MATFQVRGTNYKSKPMDAMLQLKVLKRLARFAPAMKDIASQVKASSEKVGAPADIGDLLQSAGPLAEAVSSMPDADLMYIVEACLDLVERPNAVGQGWSRVRVNGVIMFSELTLFDMLAISWYVLQDNLSTVFQLANQA